MIDVTIVCVFLYASVCKLCCKAEEGETRARSGGADKPEKSDLGSSLMSVLVISGVVAAAVGVAFFVTKKLKEA